MHFNSELNKLLGFTSKIYEAGTHKSDKLVMITSKDKVHLNVTVWMIQLLMELENKLFSVLNLVLPQNTKV